MDDEFYSVEELAEKLHLNIRTVRNKIQKKEIPAYKLHGRWYVIKSEMLEHIRKTGKRNIDPS